MIDEVHNHVVTETRYAAS